MKSTRVFIAEVRAKIPALLAGLRAKKAAGKKDKPDNPTGMSQPQASKKPFIYGGVVAVLLFVVMMHGLQSAGQKEQAGPVQEDIVIDTSRSLTTSDKSHGLALPETPEELQDKLVQDTVSTAAPQATESAETPGAIQFDIITQEAPDPAAQQQAKQATRLADWRFQKQLAAMDAKLKIPAASSSQSSTKTPEQVRTETDARLMELQGQLDEARSGTLQSPDTPDTEYAPDSDWTLPYERVAGAVYELKTGSIIPAILLTGISSHLPGQIIAQVSQNVWDTATGYRLLIPQGTKILGKYENDVQAGQERIFVVWERLMFPDGSAMTLSAFPGADQSGYTGMSDEVNTHFWKIMGNTALMALITGGMAYAVDSFGGNSTGSSNTPSVRDELGSELARQIGQTTMKMLEKNLSLAPTLTIRPGYRLNVVVVKDLVFKAAYEGWR